MNTSTDRERERYQRISGRRHGATVHRRRRRRRHVDQCRSGCMMVINVAAPTGIVAWPAMQQDTQWQAARRRTTLHYITPGTAACINNAAV